MTAAAPLDPSTLQQATHVPCCTSHGQPMTCARYRRTHFVEVRPCCSLDAQALATEAPPPSPPCPGCGGVMGDGDRVTRRRCGPCAHPATARGRILWTQIAIGGPQ